MAAALASRGRKVRAPQDKVLGNTQSRRREGKCNRKETARHSVTYQHSTDTLIHGNIRYPDFMHEWWHVTECLVRVKG